MDSSEVESRVRDRMSEGGMPAAFEELARMLKENPSNEAALLQRAKLRASSDEWPLVIEDCTALLAVNPSASLKGILAFAYKRSGNLNAALAEYSREIALAPEDADLYLFRSRARKEAGDMVGAKEDLTTGAELGNNAEAWRELADDEIDAGDDEAALKHLDRAVKAKPGWVTFLERGALRAALKQWERAILDLDSALLELLEREDALPQRQKAFRYLGYCKFFQRIEDPLDDLEHALAIKPDDPDALCIRGAVYLERGDVRAVHDLNEAIRVDPEHALAHAFRGDLHLVAGDKPSAARDYRKAIELAPYFEEGLRGKLEKAQAND